MKIESIARDGNDGYWTNTLCFKYLKTLGKGREAMYHSFYSPRWGIKPTTSLAVQAIDHEVNDPAKEQHFCLEGHWYPGPP